ncbi:cyclohexa-1,5-dienecarbonyl-CoA hydratase [Alteribacillus persepolensis]|uniref:Cyclohexa-1,5-dienecarbonyl-CoA hydratase n=1 Tax=Alteribacillus persepolensis TaxID=568899 RepID=A0A1G8KCG1_9BACI|nr:enoyl-CoA hydratase/isomerase family protein [Alteribacillus persepolensis]SDI41083.1 cyclohexa-1,5-dienecarbonyl-CoA hydratase [Alteribacillus persepolensis]
MSFETISLRVEDSVAFLTMQRGSVNILNIQMMEEMANALESVKERNDIHALIIQAEGKAFSAGVAVEDHVGKWTEPMIFAFHKLFHLLGSIPCPTIGAVEGAAIGGGCELASFCDITIAAESSKFGQPEINLGLFPPVSAAYFPWLMGYNRTMELLLTGKTLSAEEAKEFGLINSVVPAGQVRESVEELLNDLKNKSRSALKLTKQAVRASMGTSMSGAIAEVEQIYLQNLMKTDDAKEGLDAFMEKRQPVWSHT